MFDPLRLLFTPDRDSPKEDGLWIVQVGKTQSTRRSSNKQSNDRWWSNPSAAAYVPTRSQAGNIELRVSNKAYRVHRRQLQKDPRSSWPTNVAVHCKDYKEAQGRMSKAKQSYQGYKRKKQQAVRVQRESGAERWELAPQSHRNLQPYSGLYKAYKHRVCFRFLIDERQLHRN